MERWEVAFQWLSEFVKSPGPAALAAVLAACIAYAAARHTAVRAARDSEIQRWWENARWATDRLMATYSSAGDFGGDAAAASAIVALGYLGENAPTRVMEAFVLGVLSGVATHDDNEECETASGSEGG